MNSIPSQGKYRWQTRAANQEWLVRNENIFERSSALQQHLSRSFALPQNQRMLEACSADSGGLKRFQLTSELAHITLNMKFHWQVLQPVSRESFREDTEKTITGNTKWTRTKTQKQTAYTRYSRGKSKSENLTQNASDAQRNVPVQPKQRPNSNEN